MSSVESASKLQKSASFLLFEPIKSKQLVITYYNIDIDETEQIKLTNKICKCVDNKDKLVSNVIVTPHAVIIIHSINSNSLRDIKLSSFSEIMEELFQGKEKPNCSIIKVIDDDIDIKENCKFNERCVNDLKKLVNSNRKKEVLNIIETQ